MLKVGDKFGSYDVVKLLGQGGMGSVFLLSGVDGRSCVAKILDPATADDHEARVRFLREAELAQKVKSPYLVETYDIGEDPDTGLCYILMEYVPGGSLKRILDERGKLTVTEALSYTRQIALALEEVRRYGIVHRDIKPDNIMFGASGEIKLADLGIARSASVRSTTITKSGVLMGTPAYMSPEQMTDPHGVDIRSDIYSLGIVLFEMIAGSRPYPSATFMELMAKAVRGENLPDVRSINAAAPKGIARLIAKMCEAKLARRFKTPSEVVRAIDGLMAQRAPRRLARRPLILGGVAAAALVVIGAATFSAARRSTRAPVEEPLVMALDANAPATTSELSSERPPERPPEPETPPPSVPKEPAYVAKNGQKIYVEEVNGLNWYYRLDEKGEATLCHYKKDTDEKCAAVEPHPTGEIVVPRYLNGHKIVRLAGGAFRALDVTGIILPEGLRSIGGGAFNDCHNLKKMRFPDSVERVDAYALFRRCDVLEEIDLNRAHGFGSWAMFYAGRQLKKIKIDERYSDLKAVGRCIVNASGKELYYVEPHAENETIKIPEGVESIAPFAFAANCEKPVKVDLPRSVCRMDQFAFAWLNADTLRFPEGVTSTGYASFSYLTIRTIVLPKTFQEVNEYSFGNSNTERIVFLGEMPKGFEKASKQLNREKTRVYRPKAAKSWAAFTDYPTVPFAEKDTEAIIAGVDPEARFLAYTAKSGENVYVAEVKGLKYYYVLNTKGEAVLSHPAKESDDRLTAIEPNPTGEVKIPAELNGHKLVRLERDSLHHLKATEIKLPETLEEIGMGAFANCANLKEMRFPDSVKKVETYWLFKNCNALRMIDLNNAKGFDSSACMSSGAVFPVIKFNEERSDLKNVKGWAVRKWDGLLVWSPQMKNMKELEIPEGVEHLFFPVIHKSESKVAKITLPSSLFDVGDCSFSNLQADRLIFRSGLKKIGWRAFLGGKYDMIVFPETLEEMQAECFWGRPDCKRFIFRGEAPKGWENSVGKYTPAQTELIVPKSAKSWREVKNLTATFAEMPAVADWKATDSLAQAIRRAISKKGARTKKGESANVYLGRLTGFNGDYRNVYSTAEISRNGTFLVTGEEGDVVEFELKGYEKLTLVLPAAKLPQSGVAPTLTPVKLVKSS